jgi:TPR repeat protein
METPSSTESVTRNPLADSTSPSGFYADGEYKENAPRKPLPNIPIPPSGRIQGAPMSPVRVNVQLQDGEWPPKPSAAKIEGGDGRLREVSGESNDRSEHEQIGSPRESPLPVTHDMPYRGNYQAPRVQQAQSAAIYTAEDSGSRSPSNASFSQRGSLGGGAAGYTDETASPTDQQVPRLQYHHHSQYSDGGPGFQQRASSSQYPSGSQYPQNDLAEIGASINRHLTPNSAARRTPIQRPASAQSDLVVRGRSPAGYPGSLYHRAPSVNSQRSYDSRPLSYIDLANVSYPQAPPVPNSMDNSQLRSAVGSNASLLSMTKTLAMYRENVKKVNDPDTQYAFAIFLIQCAQESGLGQENEASPKKSSPKSGRDLDSPYIDGPQSSPQELLREAKHVLQRLSDRGYPFAQYYLADGYASGLFNKGKEDYATAFPLFVSASKHGHAESGYRAALCYEFGWGCRKDPAKAVQFYRQSASKNHPGAMTRLGRACLSGDLGMNKYREGLKWLNRATESADMQYNAAPYHLGLLYETGYGDDVFQDEVYAAKLFTQAADLGHAEASYRLGDAYEHGKLSCPRDPALSVHFYTGAAQRGHPGAMMALCAWYMVGAEPVLEKDENEAYEWARQAAGCGQLLLRPLFVFFTPF